MCSFPHFSPTWFDILRWNFAYDFVVMYYRSNSCAVTFRQFLKELCLFLNLERRVGRWVRKPVNHTSWVAVVTPTDRPKSVRNCCLIELFCVVVCVVTLSLLHFCWYRGFCHRTGSDLLLFVLEYRKCAICRTFLLHTLTYWAEILHMTLFLCTTDQV